MMTARYIIVLLLLLLMFIHYGRDIVHFFPRPKLLCRVGNFSFQLHDDYTIHNSIVQSSCSWMDSDLLIGSKIGLAE